MTLLPLLAVAIGGGLLAWMARHVRGGAVLGAAALLLLALLARWLPEPAAPATLGGEAVAMHGYLRLFLAVGALTGALLAILFVVLPSPPVDSAAPPMPRPIEPGPAPAFLLFLAAAALALGVVAPNPALLPAAAGGIGGFVAVGRLSSASRPRSGGTDEALAEAEAGALSRRLGAELLRVAIALALAVTALELLIGLADVVAGQPFGVGAAALALALAVALRMGFVPVHGHAARLAANASRAAVPVLSLWGPALFALAALAAFEAAVVPLGLPLSIERGVIAGLAILTIVAGGVAALVQDDIDHVVAYSILQDSGIVLLAFAAADSGAWGAARTWLLVLPVTKTALLAWSLATGRTFGTRSLFELRGWARRAPLLGFSLALVTLATIGLPGLASFDARLTLLRGALAEPIRAVVLLASLSSVIVVARILLVGIDRPMALVEAAPDERLRRPPSDMRRRVGRTMGQTVDLNRAPLSAALVLGLALVASGVGAGLFGLRGAASEDRPAVLPGPQPTVAPGPTFRPVATDSPSIVPAASAS